MPAATPSAGLPTPQRWYAMATILLGIALSVIDSTVVNLALPGMVRDFHASASAGVWVVNAYQLATLVLLLPLAHLGERWTYRRVYLGGAIVFTAASALCAMADSLWLLAAARALQGAGAAGIMAVNAALVRMTYPPEHLGRGIAINSITVATASVAGPVVAAAILSVASWPWLFLVNLPLGIVLVLLGRRVLPCNEVRRGASEVSPLDVVLNGSMFVLLFLGADLLGASVRGSDGDAGAARWGAMLLAACIAVGIVHVRRQRSRTHPLLPIDLLRIPVFRLSMATSVCAFAAQMSATIALPFLFLEAWNLAPSQAGLLMACWPLGVIVAAMQAGRMIGRWHDGLLGALGLAILASGLALMAITAAGSSPQQAWWRLALCGIGFGLFQSPNNHTIITSAPPQRAGAASGMLGTARLTGQSTGAALLALVYAITSAREHGGASMALSLAAGLAAVAAVFSALRIRTTRH
ncbi:MFS transporter [Ramlibacter algicola]|uniref:MFS transporter n=1 Tax=Ramlibacter algicola TaxID=2795217 RepID=A0A934PXD4_9BURK|nr:MFS transporter [Ramlibacter algicola]MBK0392239.1 MFS transporter [Ramlibacter algicola]